MHGVCSIMDSIMAKIKENGRLQFPSGEPYCFKSKRPASGQAQSTRWKTVEVPSKRPLHILDCDSIKFMHVREDNRAICKVGPSVELDVDNPAILSTECSWGHFSGYFTYGSLTVGLLMEAERTGVVWPSVLPRVCYRNGHATYGEGARGTMAFICYRRGLAGRTLHRSLGTSVIKRF